MNTYETICMTTKQITGVIDHIAGLFPGATIEKDIDNGLVYIELGFDKFIVIYPPRGYLTDELIKNGWICLQNIFQGDTDLLEQHPIIRGITIQNYQQLAIEIYNIVS